MDGILSGAGIGLGLVLEHPALVHSQTLFSHVADQQQPSGSIRGTDLQLLQEFRGSSRIKSKSLAMSDEEEPSFTEECGDGHNGEAKNKKTPSWQRMKWTDSMVKLLIGVVLLVGDDNCLEGLENGNKRKVGILQKKGKWKSVAQLMMGKGCYVSPQQCEDKFNDLNKRYKRLNEVLGKEHASAVVENHGLLRSMDHLSPKAMDDARKILSSRHLFYKEMVAYHSGDTAALAAELDFESPYHQHLASRALGTSETGRAKYDNSEDDDEVDEDEEMDEDVNRDDVSHKIGGPGGDPGQVSALLLKRRKVLQQQHLEDTQMDITDAEELDGKDVDARNQLALRSDCKVVGIDNSQQWKKSRAMQLKEQKMGLQAEAFNLEKQRFKWQKVTCKKDREIERMRLENERMKLENERIALQLKQRELELDSKKSEISMSSIAMILEKLNANDKKEPASSESGRP